MEESRNVKAAYVLAVIMVAGALWAAVSLMASPTPSQAPLKVASPVAATTAVGSPIVGLPEVIRLPSCEDTVNGSSSCIYFDEGVWWLFDTPVGADKTALRLCDSDTDSGCLSPRQNRQGTFNLYLS